MFHIRVRWDYYVPRQQGPTQCSRCQMFGHGAENCYRQFKCVSCGGDHDSKSCDKRIKPSTSADNKLTPEQLKDVKPKVPDDQVLCANCGGKHTASYRGCKARREYLDKLKKRITRQSHRRTQQFVYYDRDFPAAPIPSTNPWFNRAQTQPTTVPNHSSDTSFVQILKMQQEFQQQMFTLVTQMVNQITSKMEEMMKTVMSLVNTNNINQINSSSLTQS